MQENNSVEDSMSMLDLISLRNILDEYDLQTAMLEKSEFMPLSSLVVNLSDDYKGRSRTLSFSFLPLPPDYFPDIKIMQIYSEFHCSVAEEQKATMEQLIIKLNKLLTLGSLGFSDSHNVYFRYVHTIGKFTNLKEAESTLINLFDLITYSLDINEKVLDQVALGEKTLEVAFAEFLG